MATVTNVTGSTTLNLNFAEIVTSGVVSTLNLPATINQTVAYGNGTSTGNVDYIYAKQLSLAGSATTLDLTSLTDLNGGSVNFARVREVVVVNLATTAAYTVTIGPGASNPWTTGPIAVVGGVVLQPSVGQTTGNSTFRASDPWSVGATTGWYVDGTHKTLKLDPGANTISVYVVLVGCSATT